MKEKIEKIIGGLGLLAIASLLFFGVFAAIASADAKVPSYTPLAPIADPLGNANAKISFGPGGSGLQAYLSNIYKIGVAGALALAVFMIVYGGFRYATTDAVTNKERGKEIITNALYGVGLVLVSYVILNTINPNLVSLQTNFGPDIQIQNRLEQPVVPIDANNGVVGNTALLERANANSAAINFDQKNLSSAQQALNALIKPDGTIDSAKAAALQNYINSIPGHPTNLNPNDPAQVETLNNFLADQQSAIDERVDANTVTRAGAQAESRMNSIYTQLTGGYSNPSDPNSKIIAPALPPPGSGATPTPAQLQQADAAIGQINALAQTATETVTAQGATQVDIDNIKRDAADINARIRAQIYAYCIFASIKTNPAYKTVCKNYLAP